MKPILVLAACLVASQAAPTPGYLGYNVNQVNLDNTFLTKPSGFDYTINYPEYPIYPGLLRQDAPTFHSFKPQYPPHLYPYQAVFFVSTVGAPQPPPAGASFAFRPRPDYPDVDLGQYEQANVYTVDYVQDPNAPALHPGGPILAPLPVVPAFDRTPEVQEEAVLAHFEPVDQPEEKQNEDLPTLDLNPYRLPMLPEEEMNKEVPAMVKTSSDDEPMPAPSTNLDDDVKKIPIYVSSEEGSVEVNNAAKDHKEEMAAPSTDLFDDVKKIVESDVVSDSEGVTDAPEAAAESASEGEVDLLEATTEAPVSSSSIEAVKQEEGSTESTMTSTETSS